MDDATHRGVDHPRRACADGELARNKAKRDEELEAMRYGHDNIMQVAAKHGLPETLTHYGVVLALSDKIAQLSGKEKK